MKQDRVDTIRVKTKTKQRKHVSRVSETRQPCMNRTASRHYYRSCRLELKAVLIYCYYYKSPPPLPTPMVGVGVGVMGVGGWLAYLVTYCVCFTSENDHCPEPLSAIFRVKLRTRKSQLIRQCLTHALLLDPPSFPPLLPQSRETVPSPPPPPPAPPQPPTGLHPCDEWSNHCILLRRVP